MFNRSLAGACIASAAAIFFEPFVRKTELYLAYEPRHEIATMTNFVTSVLVIAGIWAFSMLIVTALLDRKAAGAFGSVTAFMGLFVIMGLLFDHGGSKTLDWIALGTTMTCMCFAGFVLWPSTDPMQTHRHANVSDPQA